MVDSASLRRLRSGRGPRGTIPPTPAPFDLNLDSLKHRTAVTLAPCGLPTAELLDHDLTDR